MQEKKIKKKKKAHLVLGEILTPNQTNKEKEDK